MHFPQGCCRHGSQQQCILQENVIFCFVVIFELLKKIMNLSRYSKNRYTSRLSTYSRFGQNKQVSWVRLVQILIFLFQSAKVVDSSTILCSSSSLYEGINKSSSSTMGTVQEHSISPLLLILHIIASPTSKTVVAEFLQLLHSSS